MDKVIIINKAVSVFERGEFDREYLKLLALLNGSLIIVSDL